MKKAVFKINIATDNGPFEWHWLYRYTSETDLYHKKVLSKKQQETLEKSNSNSKENCILADFLYYYKPKMGMVDGRKRRVVSRIKCDFSLIVADYDRLPQGFSSYQKFRNYLSEKFPDALVLPSPSGKAKVFFLVRQDMKEDTFEQGPRWHALKAMLGEERLMCFDSKVTALYKVYFNSEMLKMWQQNHHCLKLMGNVSSLAAAGGFIDESSEKRKLKQKKLESKNKKERVKGFTKEVSLSLDVLDVSEDPVMDYRVMHNDNGSLFEKGLEEELQKFNKIKAKRMKPIQRYKGEIPHLLKKLIGKQSVHFEKFLRVVIASPNLSVRTILPQEAIAKEINCSVALVNRYILRLIDNKFLFDIDKNYMKGVKAKGYRAYNELKDVHEEYMKTRPYSAKLKMDAKDIIIEDGDWNRKLFSLTNYFSDKESYLDYIEQIPGIKDKKTRKSQAEWAWTKHVKRNKNFIK